MRSTMYNRVEITVNIYLIYGIFAAEIFPQSVSSFSTLAATMRMDAARKAWQPLAAANNMDAKQFVHRQT